VEEEATISPSSSTEQLPLYDFSKKWPRLRNITWPLAKAKSSFIASIQRSELKHKAPQVRFTQHNVAVSFLRRKCLFWVSHFQLSDQDIDKYGQLMLQIYSSPEIAP